VALYARSGTIRAAGQLWFSWGCESSPHAGIGRIDPETRDYNLNAAPVDERISSPALLATVPSQPDMVIAGTTGESPSTLYRFEATPTQLVQQAWRWTDEFGHLPDQETWPNLLEDGGLAWGPGNRLYAVTDQFAEPDVVTLRILEVS
jgi:hypothetical protein